MSAPSNVEATVKEFVLREFLPGEDPAHLEASTPLLSSGVLDSIATLKLVSFLEDTFSITIAAHEADREHLDTLHLIGQFVRSKIGSFKGG